MRVHNSFPLCLHTANKLLTGGIANVTSFGNANFKCTFLSGFTGSSRCQVQYGTDPTFRNLPYSAESTVAGSAGDSVDIVLEERLNSLTEYYYNLSAVNGCLNVTVQGIFITPKYRKHSMHLFEKDMYTLIS